MTVELSARVTHRLRTAHTIAAVLLGVAIVATLYAVPRIALSCVILVLFVQLYSLEALRVLASTLPEKR